MSIEGVKKVAKLFSEMQLLRQELLRIGTENGAAQTPSGKQDIMLSQMLQKMDQDISPAFMKIVDGKTP